MTISKIIILYLLTLPLLPLFDIAWLGFIAKDFYQSHLGHLMRADIAWGGAIAFYIFFVAGLCYFAILPSISSGEWVRALILGALYGFFTYMTYDLTNYATLKDWPLIVVFVDMLWGTLLSGFLAVVGFSIGKFIA